MMTREELQAFCAGPDDIRYALHEPWSAGEWTYATNGHIAVRVPRLADVPEVSNAPNAAKLFDAAVANEWFPVPACLQPPDDYCPQCKGTLIDRYGHECGWCENGKVENFDGIEIGDASYAKRYLAMIQGWEIAPNGPRSPAPIRNGDVQGLLMPRRTE